MSIAFVWLESRNPAAMLFAALWQDRVVRCATVIGMLANQAFYDIVFTLSLLFQSVRHMTPVRTGVAFLPMLGILVIVNIVAGRLARRGGARAPFETLTNAKHKVSTVRG